MNDNEQVAIDKLRSAIASVERKYQFAVGQTDKKSFFIGIADYVKAVDQSVVLAPLVRITVIDDRDKAILERDRLGNLVIAEAKKVYTQVRKTIDEKKIESPFIDNAVKEYEDLVTGRTKMSGHIAKNIYDGVYDVITSLQQAGREDLVKKYALLNDQQQLIEWKFAPTYPLYRAAENDIKRQLDIAVWGAWNELWWAYASVHKQDEMWKGWVDKKDHLAMMDASLLFGEMNTIIEERAKDDYHHFEVDVFKRHLTRFHNELLDQVQQVEEELVAKPVANETIQAELKGNLLLINGQNIPLRQGSKQLDICRVIFKNKQSMIKTWEAADILKSVDSEYFEKEGQLKPKYRRVVYNAIEKISVKILTLFGVSDYFEFGISTVRINRKYLKKSAES